jgi:hypothetical protein
MKHATEWQPVLTEFGPGVTPEDVLAATDHPGPRRDLDPAAGVYVMTWSR